MSPGEIDPFNKYVVGVSGRGILIVNQPIGPLSEEDARLLAAWLVALSGGLEAFVPVLRAVEGT